MGITLEDISALKAGQRDHVLVGELPISVARHMQVPTTSVYLSKESLEHINKDHEDIDDVDLLLASLAIRDGWFLREVRNPKIYLCSYFDSLTSRRFGIPLKIASPNREVYMVSFYRTHRRQVISWQKRCTSVRTHR